MSTPSGSPTAFISYSHDSPEHKEWVRSFAEDLRHNGIEVILDAWHLNLGDELPKFMEQGIAHCDYTLLICSATYVAKANARAGGVGYETGIVTSQLLTRAQIDAKEPSTIIPVVRQSQQPRVLPIFAGGRLYVDLSADTDLKAREAAYEQLVRTLHRTPKHRVPAVGRNPYAAQAPELSIIGANVAPPSDPELRRKLRTLRVAAADALVARQSGFAYIAGATEAIRSAELMKALRTHEEYFLTCVAAVFGGLMNAELLAEEIEQVIQPSGWSGAGPSRVVELPYALGWSLHRLTGAALLCQSRPAEAVKLALESIEDIQGTRRPIIMRRNLTGWPILFGNSREAWDYAHVLPIEWPWLNTHFGDREEYRVGLVAHALTLNFAEFQSRVRNGPPFEQIREDREHGPYVPPYYIDETTDIRRRAARMLTRDRDGLRAMLGELATDPTIRQKWTQWVTFQQTWHSIESVGADGGAVPHADLVEQLLAGEASQARL
jgi:TIR domain